MSKILYIKIIQNKINVKNNIKDIIGVCVSPLVSIMFSGKSFLRHVAHNGINTVYISFPFITAKTGNPDLTTQLMHCIITDMPENAVITAATERFFAPVIMRALVISIIPTATDFTSSGFIKKNTLAKNSGRPDFINKSAIIPKKIINPQTPRQFMTELEILLQAASVILITPVFLFVILFFLKHPKNTPHATAHKIWDIKSIIPAILLCSIHPPIKDIR